MKTLHEKINSDLILAMKSGDRETLNILRVIKGEFGRVGKDLLDNQAIPILKKMVQNAKDLNNLEEAKIIERYLPEMLGENQIKTIVAGIIQIGGYSSIKDMGTVMSGIKSLPMADQIDGKIASGIVREMLK